MQCAKCQNPVTSHWITEPTPLRLECPNCGTGLAEPYPELPVIALQIGTKGQPQRRWRRLILISCLLILLAPLLTRFFHNGDGPATAPQISSAATEAVDIRAMETRTDPAHGKAEHPGAKAKSSTAAKCKSPVKQPSAPPAPPKKRGSYRSIPPRPGAKDVNKRPGAARPSAGRSAKGAALAQTGGQPGLHLPPVLFAGLSPVRGAAVYWPKLILASCHSDDTIRLWDLRSRDTKLREIKSESGTPTDLVFHPSGGPLAVVTNHRIAFYSVPGLEKIGGLESSGELSSCAFSSNGAYLAVAQAEGGIVLRTLSTFEIVGRLPAYGGTQYVTWSPQGGELLVASADNAIRLWDPDHLDVPTALAGHMDWVSCLAVASDRRRVVTGSWDFSARAWDLNTRRCISMLPSHRARVTATAISNDGSLAASGDAEGTIRIWAPSTGTETGVLRGHSAPITTLAFHDDRLVLSTSRDGSARTWQLAERLQWPTGELTAQEPPNGPRVSRYTTALAEANRLARRGDHARAIAQVRQAAALRPEYVEAHLALAERRRAGGQHREAITSYKDALKLRPKSGWLWRRLGSLLLEIGALEQACALLPDLLPARLTLGKSLLRVQSYDDAREAFEAALATQPNSHEIHNGLGQSYTGLANWGEAIEHYRRAIDIKREYAPAYSNLIDTLLAAGPEHRNDAQNWAQLAASLGIELRPDTRDRLKRVSSPPEQ